MKRGKNLAQRLTLPQEVVSQGPLAELHGNTSVCIKITEAFWNTRTPASVSRCSAVR